MYKCTTRSGNTAYFNVPGAVASTARTPTPAGFPKVDAGTQKGRDILRNKVLTDELATEEKLLAEARTAYGDGTPPPLPDEKANAQKYADRLARLRQAVALHEKNIEALKRELAASRGDARFVASANDLSRRGRGTCYYRVPVAQVCDVRAVAILHC